MCKNYVRHATPSHARELRACVRARPLHSVIGREPGEDIQPGGAVTAVFADRSGSPASLRAAGQTAVQEVWIDCERRDRNGRRELAAFSRESRSQSNEPFTSKQRVLQAVKPACQRLLLRTGELSSKTFSDSRGRTRPSSRRPDFLPRLSPLISRH